MYVLTKVNFPTIFWFDYFSGSNFQKALSDTAQQLLAAPTLEVTGIDQSRLENLLSGLVSKTDCWCVERLQRIYSALAASIYEHRKKHDKTILIQVR